MRLAGNYLNGEYEPRTLTPQDIENLKNKEYRLSHLYYIIDEGGNRVLFRPNKVQRYLLRRRWYLNIVLKARQLGCTTFIDLFILDECLFHSNTEAIIIAHKKTAASEIFRRKILYPYDNLPEDLKTVLKCTTRSKTQVVFSNGSTITVDTSARSGTFQLFHISELGSISVKEPEKAREIITGVTEAVALGGMGWIESTGEGQGGVFHDMSKVAHDMQIQGDDLTEMDYKFHFAAWFWEPRYTLDAKVVISKEMKKYFEGVELEIGFKLTKGQKNWYVKKRGLLGDDVTREHPSTPDEAFLAKIKGAYFTTEFQEIRKTKRITKVPYDENIPVDTSWDLGMNDMMAIWFSQTVGKQIRLFDYYEASGEGFKHYANMLEEKGYVYGTHYGPHDLAVRELGTGKSRLEAALALGIKFQIVKRVDDKGDAIETGRQLLGSCWFDAENCEEAIDYLERYRKEWDEKMGIYKNRPLHDVCSNCADAFLTLAMGHSFSKSVRKRNKAIDAAAM